VQGLFCDPDVVPELPATLKLAKVGLGSE